MATTVVVTPQALEGIAAVPGRDLLLAAGAGPFAAAVAQALAAPDRAIGRAARGLVEEKYGWDANLAPVVTKLEQPNVEDILWNQA